MLRKRTIAPKAEEITRKWYLVDGTDKILGRLASHIAYVLRGKHKPLYAPYADVGDHVVVINVDKLVLTGRKINQKVHYRHSGYPGGLRATDYQRMMNETPERALMLAVRRMLPQNNLGRKMLKKLRVYSGSVHEHEAQNPETTDFQFLNK